MTETTQQIGTAGHYDAIAGRAREEAEAQAVVLIVINGRHGNGFSVQEAVPPGGLPIIIGERLADLLRIMADHIEAGASPNGIHGRFIKR